MNEYFLQSESDTDPNEFVQYPYESDFFDDDCIHSIDTNPNINNDHMIINSNEGPPAMHSMGTNSDQINYKNSLSINTMQFPINSSNRTSGRPNRKGRGPGFLLNDEEEKFRKQYYITISDGKKNIFAKEYVIGIHDNFIAPDLNLKKVSRISRRSIRKYFHDFISEARLIISCLEKKRNDILFVYPELRNY